MSAITLCERGHPLRYTFEFCPLCECPDQVGRLVSVAKANGHEISIDQAIAAWRKYSDDVCATWLYLPRSDEILWRVLKDELPTLEIVLLRTLERAVRREQLGRLGASPYETTLRKLDELRVTVGSTDGASTND